MDGTGKFVMRESRWEGFISSPLFISRDRSSYLGGGFAGHAFCETERA